MAIGNLDRRIILANYTATISDIGEPVFTYATLATVWAWVKYLKGDERLIQTKETVTADCVFVIRYRTLTEKTRIQYGSDYYDIIHIAELGRRKYLELTARRVA